MCESESAEQALTAYGDWEVVGEETTIELLKKDAEEIKDDDS